MTLSRRELLKRQEEFKNYFRQGLVDEDGYPIEDFHDEWSDDLCEDETGDESN